MDPKKLRRLAALIGAGVLATGGAAIAATAQLPSDLPEESRAEQHVGSADGDAADRGADVDVEDGALADAGTGADEDVRTEVATDPDANDYGQAVSTLAQETDLEGRERGEAIAELASSNRQDGERTDQATIAQVGTEEDGTHEAEGSRATGEEASSAAQDRGDDRDRDDD